MASIPAISVLDEVMDFLLSAPTPQQIIDFRASEELQERVRYLLEKNQDTVLTAEEQEEMENLSWINHFMIMLKAKAHKKLRVE
jgi:hypothetical protein